MRPVALAVALLVVGAVTPATAVPTTVTRPPDSADGETNATINRVYPNPVTSGDRGEFVVLTVPDPGRLSDCNLTDGEGRLALSDANTSTVAVATDPVVAKYIETPVRTPPGDLALSNGGERVALVCSGAVVDAARYADAPEGEVGIRADGRLRWRPLGATAFPVVRAGSDDVRAFVLPDAPGPPIEPIRAADRRVLLAGYTLTSERVVRALVEARERGATVRVLLEGNPIGGLTRRQARLTDRLVAAGVEVRLLSGPRDRYAYHHAKYVVADDRAVVLTENWKPAGTGGNSSRGWGVVTDQPSIVDALARTFRADADWHDAIPWSAYSEGRRFERGGRATGRFPSRFEPRRVGVDRITLLRAPGTAGRQIVERIDRANESISVIQASIGDWDGPYLLALRRAARRGVAVRLLLSGAWYAREENSRVAKRLNEWAARADAPLTARVAEPAGRYAKIHAKGAIVDDSVILGSLNWNAHSAAHNREVVLVLHGEAIAAYYREVYEADWQGGERGLPLGPLGALVAVGTLAVIVARRIEFE